MEALDFLTASQNLPFAVSGMFLLLLLLLEVVSVLFTGVGVSSIGDLIHGDGHHVELGDIAADALGYLHWGKVPMIVILAALSGLFALTGYGLQGLAASVIGGLLPGWLASIPAAIGAVVGAHLCVSPIARLMPKDSGDAPTHRDMMGLVGLVTLGPVASDSAGEARVRDLRGRDHFVPIRAEAPGGSIPTGDEIVITGRVDGFYTVARTSAPASLSANRLAPGGVISSTDHTQKEG